MVLKTTAPSRPSRWAKARIFVLLLIVAAALAVLALQAQHTVAVAGLKQAGPICRVSTTSHNIALSFDDGPEQGMTNRILDLLKSVDGHATFFVAGRQVTQNPSLLEEEFQAGMEVGNHTFSHPHLETLTTDQLLAEVAKTGDLLGYRSAPLFRPPYGEITTDQMTALTHDVGYKVIVWSRAVDPLVSGGDQTTQAAADVLVREVQPGDIILAHDAIWSFTKEERDASFDVLATALPALKEKGFSFVSVGSLLEEGDPVRAQPRPWFWQDGFNCP